MNEDIRFRAASHRVEGVEYEIAQEKASALRRAGKRLDEALAALRALDEAPGGAAPSAGPDRAGRAELVNAAAEALWYYVVQREACRLRADEGLMRELGVPREVRMRMGVRKRP